MNKTEQDWNKLIDEWQQEETNSDTKAQQMFDEEKHVKTLANKAIKDRKLEQINVIFTAVVALVACIYLFIEISLGLPSKFDYVLYYSMLILIMMLGIFTVWYQRGVWKFHAEHSAQYIELMLRQNRATTKVAKVGEMLGYGILLTFYGIVSWAFFPSLLTGTLVEDLSSIAKPVMGSMILLFVTVTGLSCIFFNRKLHRSLAQKADTLQSLMKDFQ